MGFSAGVDVPEKRKIPLLYREKKHDFVVFQLAS
jgi:hypothetical protein